MSELLEASKLVVPILVSPFVSAIMETRVKPMLNELFAKQKTDSQVLEHSWDGKFEEYLKRAYERQSYITTVVFQNQKKQLKDLYQPLTVTATQDKGTSREAFQITSFGDDFIPAYERVLLTDAAGMGKSTLLRFLFLKCLEQNAGIPVFIELRRLSEHESILDILYDELSPIEKDVDKDFILSLVSRGDFIFFLDGYDEVPTDQRTVVTRDIQDFVSKAHNNLFLLSSRPEQALAAFNDFQSFAINPLKKEEAYELISKYAEGRDIGDKLISKLEEPSSASIYEFLTNPLLVSLLFKSYEYKPTLPLKKPIFYRQVYDALFEAHDLTKGDSFIRPKHCKLDSDDFHRVMRALGFLMFRAEKLSDTKDPWLKYIADAKKVCAGLEFKVSDFFLDLTTTVPLIARDGSEYKWSHKSIQEYFAAQFVCLDTKGKQSDLLKRFSEDRMYGRYANLLDLCYDIDYRSFRNSILHDLIHSFIEFYEKQFGVDVYTDNATPSLRFCRQMLFRRDIVWFPDSVIKASSKLSDQYDIRDLVNLASAGGLAPPFPSVVNGFSTDLGQLLFFLQQNIYIVNLLAYKRNEIMSDFPEQHPHIPQDDTSEASKRIAKVLPVNKITSLLPVLNSFKDDEEAIKELGIFLCKASGYSDFHVTSLDIQKCLALKTEIEEDLKGQEDGSLFAGFE